MTGQRPTILLPGYLLLYSVGDSCILQALVETQSHNSDIAIRLYPDKCPDILVNRKLESGICRCHVVVTLAYNYNRFHQRCRLTSIPQTLTRRNVRRDRWKIHITGNCTVLAEASKLAMLFQLSIIDRSCVLRGWKNKCLLSTSNTKATWDVLREMWHSTYQGRMRTNCIEGPLQIECRSKR